MKLSSLKNDSYKKSISGLAKLGLFRLITGKSNEIPTKKQASQFIQVESKRNFTFAELFTYILTDGSYSQVNFKDINSDQNFRHLSIRLDIDPLKKPVLYEIKNFQGTTKRIAVWITCESVKESDGKFYTLIFFDKTFPTKIIFYCEIRSSQLYPEPAFIYYNKHGRSTTLNKNDRRVNKHPFLMFSLGVLHYLNENYLGTFIPINKAAQAKLEQKLPVPPVDAKLQSLLALLGKNQITCKVAEVNLSEIIPHNFSYCFNIPLNVIEYTSRQLDTILDHGILVYWQNGKYVMSDCYPSYLALLASKIKMAKIILLGDAPPTLKALKIGGFELLPPVQSMPSSNFEDLDIGLKNLILQKYIQKIGALDASSALFDAKCILLTEDSNTEFLEAFLIGNGFNIDEVIIWSYKGSTNINSLEITAKIIRDLNPEIEIIIHRDKDYMLDSEISKIKDQIIKMKAFPFITSGNEIESYFVNPNHIAFLYPNISKSEITKIISSALLETKSYSLDCIRKHEHGEKYKAKASYLDVESVYKTNPRRYMNGKKMYGVVSSLLQKRLKLNANLSQPSRHLVEKSMKTLSSSLWPNNIS